MKFLTKTGFTLIELLVVITIIGILATGATTVYTSQIQKARDTTRITDVKALESGIQQVYQDAAEYPGGDDFGTGTSDGFAGVQTYVPRLPSDSKSGQNCNNGGGAGTTCGYVYVVNEDENGINFGSFEISTAFESTGNVTSKANGDGGRDDARLEIGLRLDFIDSSIPEDSAWTGTPTGAEGETVIIDGDAFLLN